MIFFFRGLARTADYAPRWWRWTLRDPVRMLILLTAVASIAAVPASDRGESWASPVELLGGLAIITIFVAARWFWAGPSVVSRRMSADPEFHSHVAQLVGSVGLTKAVRIIGDSCGKHGSVLAAVGQATEVDAAQGSSPT